MASRLARQAGLVLSHHRRGLLYPQVVEVRCFAVHVLNYRKHITESCVVEFFLADRQYRPTAVLINLKADVAIAEFVAKLRQLNQKLTVCEGDLLAFLLADTLFCDLALLIVSNAAKFLGCIHTFIVSKCFFHFCFLPYLYCTYIIPQFAVFVNCLSKVF